MAILVLNDKLRGILETDFAPTLGKIALDYLCWRQRLEFWESYEGRSARRSAKPVSFALNAKDDFGLHVRELHPGWSKEDVDAAIRILSDACPCLVDWMEAVVHGHRIELEFENDEPRIVVRSAKDWIALTNCFDPDTIVCYFLALRGWRPDLQMRNWGITTRIGEHDLDVYLTAGLSDVHVHLGGIRSGQIYWRNLLDGRIQLQHIRAYSPKALAAKKASDQSGYRERLAERDRIASLKNELTDRSTPLGRYWSDPYMRLPTNMPAERKRLIDGQIRERMMLTRAWEVLLDWKKNDLKSSVRTAELQHRLDRYIFAKNTFLVRHVQPSITNPGLNTFREYYGSTSLVGPPNMEPLRMGRSPRLMANEFAEYGAYLAQSRALRRVELRIGPRESRSSYHLMMKAWELVEEEFNLAAANIDIRFAIHFKRSLDSPRNKSKEARADPGRALRELLRSLDRDSQVLHRYLNFAIANGSHADWISRLDFAGSERDCASDLAAFCINLLRNDPQALQKLDGNNCNRDIHRNWLYLRKQNLHRIQQGRPPLGVTCHAGEDNAHPLEGIYAVASTVKSLQMRAGDTIGHGLSLGYDVPGFDKTRSRQRLTVRGQQFDAVLWLYIQCLKEAPSDLRIRAHSFEPWLRSEATEIYNLPAGSMTSIALLRELFERRVGPLPASQPQAAQDLCGWLHYREFFNVDCARRRAEAVPIAEEIYKQEALVSWAQRHVRKDIAEKGIILEFNPSSNLRVSGSMTLKEIPFMAMLRVAQTQILATLNTDNPGVFGTRIENEYALVMQALVDVGISRAAALAILERLRDVGQRFVGWNMTPRSKPAGSATPGRQAIRTQ